MSCVHPQMKRRYLISPFIFHFFVSFTLTKVLIQSLGRFLDWKKFNWRMKTHSVNELIRTREANLDKSGTCYYYQVWRHDFINLNSSRFSLPVLLLPLFFRLRQEKNLAHFVICQTHLQQGIMEKVMEKSNHSQSRLLWLRSSSEVNCSKKS